MNITVFNKNLSHVVENQSFELAEAHLVLVIYVMLVHDLLYLDGGQMMTKFGEGIAQRSRADLMIV